MIRRPSAALAIVASPAPVVEHPAIDYLYGLFLESDFIFIQLIHSSKTHVVYNKKTGKPLLDRDGKERRAADTKLLPLVKVADAVKPEYMASLQAYEDAGWNVYVCMNPFPEGTTTRTESLITTVRNLYLDVDKTKENGERALQLIEEAVKAGLIPPPTSILESSPGNYHITWAVEDFTPAQAKAMLPVMASRLGGDMAAIDLHRVLRMPGFKNLKKGREGFTCQLVSSLFGEAEPYSLSDFKLPIVVEEREKTKASPERVEMRVGYIVANAAEAEFELGDGDDRADGGVSWIIECPWKHLHTQGGDTAMLMVLGDGRPEFNCFHGHCNGTEGPPRGWSDIRKLWEEKVGHFQRFGPPDEASMLIKKDTNEAPAVQSSSQDALSKVDQIQAEYEKASADADQASEEFEERLVEAGEYPLHVWEGTPYYEYALLACGEGEKANFIPASFHVNCLATVVGAICGNRIAPDFSLSMPAHFYTIMLSNEGGKGKNTAGDWSRSCFRGTGLLYQSGLKAHRNIGAFHDDFASARMLISTFAEYPSVLEEYPELTTLTEKFGIENSGESFLNFILNSYDSMVPNWSRVKGMKLPSNLPTEINNSILAGTVIDKWKEKIQGDQYETLIQRLNLVFSDETRTVPILWDPDVTAVQRKLMDRVGLLEEYKLIWHYNDEATNLIREWHADLAERQAEIRANGTKEYEAFERIQVFAHRIVGHLALWLAPLPTAASGLPATPSYIDGAVDNNGRPVLMVRRAEGMDKQWSVEVPADWVKRAIEASEYLIRIRLGLVPPPGQGVRGKIQNQIKKWAQTMKRVKWTELQRRANLYKHDYDEVEKCLKAVERSGLLAVKYDPSDSTNRRKWVVDWIGGGECRVGKVWKETRGGYREHAGRKRIADS
jgi:hypothetical protein